MGKEDFEGSYLLLDFVETFLRSRGENPIGWLDGLPDDKVRLLAGSVPALLSTAIERIRWNEEVEPLDLVADWRASLDRNVEAGESSD